MDVFWSAQGIESVNNHFVKVNQSQTTYALVKWFDSSSGGLPRFFLLDDERSFGELRGAKNGIVLSKFSLLS